MNLAWHQMASFNRIGLVARVASDQVRESLLTVEQFLLSKGVEIVVEQVSAAALCRESGDIFTLQEMGESCDLLIAVGGDGNIFQPRLRQDFDFHAAFKQVVGYLVAA